LIKLKHKIFKEAAVCFYGYAAVFLRGDKMNKEVNVRPLEAADNQPIYQIIQKALERNDLDKPGTAYFDPYLNQLYEFYQKKDRRKYWVLEKDHEVIGGIGIGPFGDYEEIAELQKFYITKKHQGNGYGSLLFKQAKSYAQAHDYKKIYIETIDVLKQANVIYKHYGFESLTEPLSGSEHGLMNRWFIKELYH